MLEEHLPPFFEHLRSERYAKGTMSTLRFAVKEFLLFLAGRRIPRPEAISQEILGEFLAARAKIFPHLWGRPMPEGYSIHLAQNLNVFFRYLVGRGVRTGIELWEKKDPCAVRGFEETLREYEIFIVRHRGLSPRTVEFYLDHAARFCRHMGRSETAAWDHITPELIYSHLRHQARGMGHLGLANVQGALRSFFRFLRVTDRCAKELDRYLVRCRRYKLSGVPRAVPVEVLYRIFEAVRGDSRSDVRDRAVLLLVTLYGLRSGEVATLTLDDVAWREKTLAVRRRKAGRPMVLPLHTAVARAIFEYVENARPRGTSFREIFLSREKPRPYLRGSGLFRPLADRLAALGIRFRPHGLRHALATQLQNNDCPPEWIQVLLGHERFQSTRVYAKVDLAHLREVAQNEGIPQ